MDINKKINALYHAITVIVIVALVISVWYLALFAP